MVNRMQKKVANEQKIKKMIKRFKMRVPLYSESGKLVAVMTEDRVIAIVSDENWDFSDCELIDRADFTWKDEVWQNFKIWKYAKVKVTLRKKHFLNAINDIRTKCGLPYAFRLDATGIHIDYPDMQAVELWPNNAVEVNDDLLWERSDYRADYLYNIIRSLPGSVLTLGWQKDGILSIKTDQSPLVLLAPIVY